MVNNQPPGAAFVLKSGTHYNFAVKPKRGQRFYAESGTTLDGNGTTAYAFYHDNAGDRPDGVVIAGESKSQPLSITRYRGNGYKQAGAIEPRSAEGWHLSAVAASRNNERGVTVSRRGSLRDSWIAERSGWCRGGYADDVI